MTITEIRQILESPYNRKIWKNFLQTQFTNNKLSKEDIILDLGKSEIHTECLSLGSYDVDEYTKIGIFEIKLKENVKLAINRVGLRNLTKSITQQVAGAMVVFVQGDKWRFSYISKRKIKNKDTNTIEDKETAPKRYTYLFGKGEKALTAAQRFDKLIQKQQTNIFQYLTLNDFEEAFSVEKLSKDFFRNYKEIYEDFVEFITGKRFVKKGNKWTEIKTHEAQFQLRNYFNNDEKAARDFFKRMLGRIIFLYFIQKKGWLAVPKGKKWGEGNADYLYQLFHNAKYKESFYSDELVPLFFETLNNMASQNEEKEFRFPYLNGGLFDKSQDFKYDKIALPSHIFAKLFDTFNNYNFTVYEDAPDEHTVAVDPEMLGHIFENLLEDNKDKGAYYTPKDIVHYMCRESLHNYIYTYTGNENNEDFKQRLQEYNDSYDIEILSKEEIKQIDRALEDVKICDPAIGSGAFPMGLLHEIYHLKIPIEDSKGFKAKSPADLKKHIIEESIYGVDIDSGAVDIARLRFWLSLVVDETTPQPLPNLAFKIVCANTLIPLGMDNTIQIAGATEIIKEIEQLRHNYFDASKEEKKDLERQFKNLQNKLWTTAKDWVTTKDSVLYEKLLQFNPFEDNSCGWFDPWWMFGVKDGFDIVIGNPPYVSAVSMSRDKGIKKTFKSVYPQATGAYDLYILFLLKAISILKSEGIYAWIIPNKFLISDYAKKTKEFLISKGLKYSIDVSTFNVFSTASVYPIILLGTNKITGNFEEYSLENFEDLPLKNFKTNHKLTTSNVFKDFGIKFSSGATGFEAEKLKGLVVNKYSKNSLPFTVSGCIDRYTYTNENVRFMGNKFDTAYVLNSEKIANSKWKLWENEKIVIAGMTKVIEAVYVSKPLAIGVGVYAIYDYAGFNPKFLLANLNSKYHSYYLNKNFKDKHLAGGYLAINKSTIENLPLVQCEKKVQLLFANLVDYLLYLHNKEKSDILSHTENNRIASNIEDVLNMMIYELYFDKHMKKESLDVLQFINPKSIDNLETDELKAEIIKEFYLWYQKPENEVRQRILLVDTRSKDKIALINKSVQ